MFVNEKKYILRYVIWYIYDLLDFDKRLEITYTDTVYFYNIYFHIWFCKNYYVYEIYDFMLVTWALRVYLNNI